MHKKRCIQSRLIMTHLSCQSEGGNGTPLWYSCLENPMDGGAWQAAVHGVAKSQTRLSVFTFTFHFHPLEREMAPTPMFLPGESQGQGSLVGCHLWGHTDTTEVTQQQQQAFRDQENALGVLRVGFRYGVNVLGAEIQSLPLSVRLKTLIGSQYPELYLGLFPPLDFMLHLRSLNTVYTSTHKQSTNSVHCIWD